MIDGDKIVEIRKKRKMKQKELANKVNISVGYMCDIEKCRTQPSIQVLQKISEVLHRKESYFLKKIGR